MRNKINKKDYLLYRKWHSLKANCRVRGYSICKEWAESFESFKAWYLEHKKILRDKKYHFVIRYDKSLGFEPSNCFLGTSKDYTKGRRKWSRSKIKNKDREVKKA